ncbi:hypothetical protein [Candidatus Nitrospira nitrosa]|uniref:hypothetical protein n=1 Tax=Candidatus Nitrospira nitrosa TaxID=1742972 RepID=UPI001146B93A|nr:hypothetical protein [Candidatus Nitrospira nitrosa]
MNRYRYDISMATLRSTWFPPAVSCLMLLVYLGLVVLAAGCAAMPIVPSEAHHHSQDATHSALCAWSCQMVSQSALAASVPTAVATVVMISGMVPVPQSRPESPSISRSSRAPPLFIVG